MQVLWMFTKSLKKREDIYISPNISNKYLGHLFLNTPREIVSQAKGSVIIYSSLSHVKKAFFQTLKVGQGRTNQRDLAEWHQGARDEGTEGTVPALRSPSMTLTAPDEISVCRVAGSSPEVPSCQDEVYISRGLGAERQLQLCRRVTVATLQI